MRLNQHDLILIIGGVVPPPLINKEHIPFMNENASVKIFYGGLICSIERQLRTKYSTPAISLLNIGMMNPNYEPFSYKLKFHYFIAEKVVVCEKAITINL